VSLLQRDRAMLAITIVLDVAFHGGRSTTVSAADIAEHLNAQRRGLEPLLQKLSGAGLLESVRGPRGGYRLGRSPRDISLLEIVNLATADEETAPPEGELAARVITPLWHELDERLKAELGRLTIQDLLERAEAAGLRRPATDPPMYVI